MALFMTNAERKRERRRLRRRALREVENAVDAARARRDGLYAKREAQWKEALRELRLGDGDGAKRLLASIAADDAALARLNARLAQFEDIERKMNLADTDAAFDETSSMLASIVNVPLDSTVKADVTPTQADIDALFGRLSQEAEHEPMHSGKGGGSPCLRAQTAPRWLISASSNPSVINPPAGRIASTIELEWMFLIAMSPQTVKDPAPRSSRTAAISRSEEAHV